MRGPLEVGSWIVAFPTIALVARPVSRRRAVSARSAIRQWAEFNDYQLVQLERVRFGDRPCPGCGTTRLAYRAKVIVPSGEAWGCYLIFGGAFNPLATDLGVRWDGGPDSSKK